MVNGYQYKYFSVYNTV